MGEMITEWFWISILIDVEFYVVDLTSYSGRFGQSVEIDRWAYVFLGNKAGFFDEEV